MVDFASLAAKAKAHHEATKTAVAKERQEKADARKKLVDDAVETLRRHVEPQLERAGSQIGIDHTIIRKFNVHELSSEFPSISFKLLGPIRHSDKYRWETMRVEFVSDGQSIEIYEVPELTEMRTARPIATSAPEGIDRFLEQAIEKVLNNYYHKLRTEPRFD